MVVREEKYNTFLCGMVKTEYNFIFQKKHLAFPGNGFGCV